MRIFQNLYRAGCVILGVGVFMTVFAFFYVTFLERPYLKYTNSPFVALGGPFKAGDIVPLFVGRCNNTDVVRSYSLARSLRNVHSNIYSAMPDAYISAPPGCSEGVQRIHRLPTDLPPGRYQLFGGAQILGMVKSFSVSWESQEFEVVE